MKKVDQYRQILNTLDKAEWEAYLMAESRLPGPRGNLELIYAFAEEADENFINQCLNYSPEIAPVNTPQGFLAACGTVGLGKLVASGRYDLLSKLQSLANDPRWRIRETVAMALQRWGKVNRTGLISEMQGWSQGTWLEQRAAAAALCEPALLQDKGEIGQVLGILDHITQNLSQAQDRRQEDFRTLRQGMGYCWSVAVAADPEQGKEKFSIWFKNPDPDIRWVIKENLKKNRLLRAIPEWADLHF